MQTCIDNHHWNCQQKIVNVLGFSPASDWSCSLLFSATWMNQRMNSIQHQNPDCLVLSTSAITDAYKHQHLHCQICHQNYCEGCGKILVFSYPPLLPQIMELLMLITANEWMGDWVLSNTKIHLVLFEHTCYNRRTDAYRQPALTLSNLSTNNCQGCWKILGFFYLPLPHQIMGLLILHQCEWMGDWKILSSTKTHLCILEHMPRCNN